MILDTGFMVVFGTLIIAFSIGLLIRQQYTDENRYDERQKLVIGKAALLALSVCITGDLLGGLLLPYLPVDGGFLMAAVGIVGATVFALSAIHANAYFGISEHWKKRTGLFIVLGILYLINGMKNFGDHAGKLSFSDINLPISIAFFIIGFYSLYTHLRMKQESEEK